MFELNILRKCTRKTLSILFLHPQSKIKRRVWLLLLLLLFFLLNSFHILSKEENEAHTMYVKQKHTNEWGFASVSLCLAFLLSSFILWISLLILYLAHSSDSEYEFLSFKWVYYAFYKSRLLFGADVHELCWMKVCRYFGWLVFLLCGLFQEWSTNEATETLVHRSNA